MVLNVIAIVADLRNDNRGISGHQFQVRKHYLLKSGSGSLCWIGRSVLLLGRGSGSCHSSVVLGLLSSVALVWGFGGRSHFWLRVPGGGGSGFLLGGNDSMSLGCGGSTAVVYKCGEIPVLLSWMWGCG